MVIERVDGWACTLALSNCQVHVCMLGWVRTLEGHGEDGLDVRVLHDHEGVLPVRKKKPRAETGVSERERER